MYEGNKAKYWSNDQHKESGLYNCSNAVRIQVRRSPSFNISNQNLQKI